MCVEIISMAQHARPNVSVHSEFRRPSAASWSSFAVITPGAALGIRLGAGRLPLPVEMPACSGESK